MTSTVDYSTTGSNLPNLNSNAIMSVDYDIHNAYNMLSKLDISKKEIEHYLVKFVQNTREEAQKSLINLTKNNELTGKNTYYSSDLIDYFNAIVNRCDEVLNDRDYIQSIVYD